MRLRASGRHPILVPSIHASAAVSEWYRRRLSELIDMMHKSTLFAVKAAWRKAGLAEDAAHDSQLAQDADPEKVLQGALNKMAKNWTKTFDKSAKSIAKGFAEKSMKHGDQAFAGALKKSGFSVRFQMTDAIAEALDSRVLENVALIRSVPAKYLLDVHKRVSRSIVGGRSMEQLTEDLQELYDMTQSRAALIARDQNNKATALVHRVRQKQVGVKRARWIHTAASVHPREEHERWFEEGETYSIDEGMYSEEDGEFVWPGTPVNCGCTSMSVVPGLDDEDEEGAA